jgi:hypothetical protein
VRLIPVKQRRQNYLREGLKSTNNNFIKIKIFKEMYAILSSKELQEIEPRSIATVSKASLKPNKMKKFAPDTKLLNIAID